MPNIKKKLSSNFLESILNKIEQEVRLFINSKINNKFIESLDITILVEDKEELELYVEIDLNAGSLTTKCSEIIEEAVNLAHSLFENKIRG
jgi:hypothetical protein